MFYQPSEYHAQNGGRVEVLPPTLVGGMGITKDKEKAPKKY